MKVWTTLLGGEIDRVFANRSYAEIWAKRTGSDVDELTVLDALPEERSYWMVGHYGEVQEYRYWSDENPPDGVFFSLTDATKVSIFAKEQRQAEREQAQTADAVMARESINRVRIKSALANLAVVQKQLEILKDYQ